MSKRAYANYSSTIKICTYSLFIFYYQDRQYPMLEPNLGQAVVINNLAPDPDAELDTKCMISALETIGLKVQSFKNRNVPVIFECRVCEK